MTQVTHDTEEATVPSLPLRKRVERAAGRVGLRLIVGPLRALSIPLARKVGRGVGSVVHALLGRYRRVALKNLALVYGHEWDEATRRRVALAVFRHFGETAALFLKLPQMSRTEVDQLVDVEGEENLCRALEMGKGALLITGHFGNWELLSRWLSLHGYPLNVVARRANDPQADKLLTDTRTGGGAQVFNRGNSARAVLACLKKKELVGLLPDQNAGDVYVPFLGQRTGTVDGPAIIHLRTGAPIVFSWCTQMTDGRFRIVFEPPLVIESSADRTNRDRDIETVMTQINARLEAQIRQHPTQWLWLHDRWKATPEVFAPLAARQGDHVAS